MPVIDRYLAALVDHRYEFPAARHRGGPHCPQQASIFLHHRELDAR